MRLLFLNQWAGWAEYNTRKGNQAAVWLRFSTPARQRENWLFRLDQEQSMNAINQDARHQHSLETLLEFGTAWAAAQHMSRRADECAIEGGA